MRGGGLFLLILGFVLGTIVTVSVLPNASLSDLFGNNAVVAAVNAQSESIARAFGGVAIGIVWAVFGLAVAAFWSGVGALFGARRKSKAH